MADEQTKPVRLLRNGKVSIGGFTFDVNNIRTDNIINDLVSGEQTVELTVVLTRPIGPEKVAGQKEVKR